MTFTFSEVLAALCFGILIGMIFTRMCFGGRRA